MALRAILKMGDSEIGVALETLTRSLSSRMGSVDSTLLVTDDPFASEPADVRVLVIPDCTSVDPACVGVGSFDHFILWSSKAEVPQRLKEVLIKWRFAQAGFGVARPSALATLMDLTALQDQSARTQVCWRACAVTNLLERYTVAEGLWNFFDEVTTHIRGVSPLHRSHLLEVQDELLTNAIWDANPKHQNRDRAELITLEESEFVRVEWAFDGTRIGISVSDSFGRFPRAKFVECARFFLQAIPNQFPKIQVTQESGAGIGLFLVLQNISSLTITEAEGVLTEVSAIVDLTKRKRGFVVDCPRTLSYVRVPAGAAVSENFENLCKDLWQK